MKRLIISIALFFAFQGCDRLSYINGPEEIECDTTQSDFNEEECDWKSQCGGLMYYTNQMDCEVANSHNSCDEGCTKVDWED